MAAIITHIASILTVRAVPVTDVVEVNFLFCIEVSVIKIAVTTAANTNEPRTTSALILPGDLK